MPRIGAPELIIILVIVVVIFGVGKLPQMGSALGKTMKAFKSGQADDEEEELKPCPRTRKKTAKKSAAA